MPNHPSIIGIDHLAVAVPDLSEAISWFHEKLGFSIDETRETVGRHSGMRSAVLRLGPITLVITEGIGANSQTSQYVRRHGPGVQHVAFRVPDLSQAIDHLNSRGISFSTPRLDSENLSQIFSTRDDASGMMIELIERRNGFEGFHDENVQRLFDALEKQGLY